MPFDFDSVPAEVLKRMREEAANCGYSILVPPQNNDNVNEFQKLRPSAVGSTTCREYALKFLSCLWDDDDTCAELVNGRFYHTKRVKFLVMFAVGTEQYPGSHSELEEEIGFNVGALARIANIESLTSDSDINFQKSTRHHNLYYFSAGRFWRTRPALLSLLLGTLLFSRLRGAHKTSTMAAFHYVANHGGASWLAEHAPDYATFLEGEGDNVRWRCARAGVQSWIRSQSLNVEDFWHILHSINMDGQNIVARWQRA